MGNELASKTSELLNKFRNLSAVALELTKEAITMSQGLSFQAALKQVENLYLNELMKTQDATEGITAFIEKRKPEWRNR